MDFRPKRLPFISGSFDELCAAVRRNERAELVFLMVVSAEWSKRHKFLALAYAIDQKVKDIERANYWKERGFNFNSDFMSAYAMDQEAQKL